MPQKQNKIIVIGAGIAGLTCAYRLLQNGADVAIYEARGRAGGRILSAKINDATAELGAQNIADGGQALHLKRLIQEFKLDVISSHVTLEHSYFEGNNFFPVTQLIENKQFDFPSLREQLHQLASHSQNLQEVLDKILSPADPLYQDIAVRLAAYEGGSIENLSTRYVETLYHMLMGSIAAAHQNKQAIDMLSLKGGNALLPHKIAKALGPCIHFSCPLLKVAKNQEGHFELHFKNEQIAKADYLVLAMPCSTYANIVFEEGIIPEERLNAIKDVRYGANAKILAPLPQALKKMGLSSKHIVSFFTDDLLTIYYTGKDSFFTKETIKDTFLQAKPMLERGYGAAFPFPVYAKDENFLEYEIPIGYSWPNDPYAKGSYSYVSASQEDLLLSTTNVKGEIFRKLFQPHLNLYFAGEYTSLLDEVPGTMEAACESGERIARCIIKSLGM